MKRNLSITDRWVRIGVAFFIALLYFTNVINGTWAIILALVGVVLVLSSMVNWCPLYHLFGFSTYHKEEPVASTGNPKPV